MKLNSAAPFPATYKPWDDAQPGFDQGINDRSNEVLKVKVKVKSLSRVQLFAMPWTVAYQAPPSVGFSRQEYWSGLPFPSPQPNFQELSRAKSGNVRLSDGLGLQSQGK